MLPQKTSDKFLPMPDIVPGCEYCKYQKIHPEGSDCPLAKKWAAFWAERGAYRLQFLEHGGESEL